MSHYFCYTWDIFGYFLLHENVLVHLFLWNLEETFAFYNTYCGITTCNYQLVFSIVVQVSFNKKVYYFLNGPYLHVMVTICTKSKEGNYQESTQSSTTPDSRYHIGKWQKHKETP